MHAYSQASGNNTNRVTFIASDTMNQDSPLFDVLETSTDPTEIVGAATEIGSDITDKTTRCMMIADAIRARGEASAREILGALSCELDPAQLTPEVAILIVASLAALFDLRFHEDGHPLSNAVGVFSTQHEIDIELSEFCMTIVLWPESIVQSLLEIDLTSCNTCVRAISFISTVWMWEQWWYEKMREIPFWYRDWLSQLKRYCPAEWNLVVERLGMRFPELR